MTKQKIQSVLMRLVIIEGASKSGPNASTNLQKKCLYLLRNDLMLSYPTTNLGTTGIYTVQFFLFPPFNIGQML